MSTSPAVKHSAFEFEFLLSEGSDHEWVLNQERRIVAALERCTRESGWGPPMAAPEVVLFYKAGGDLTTAERDAHGDKFRPKDEEDFATLLPRLASAQRGWLREALTSVRPDHPWAASARGLSIRRCQVRRSTTKRG